MVRRQELETAKQSVATLESELKAGRSKLRSLVTEQERFERERENVLAKLRCTESVSRFFPSVPKLQGLPQWVTGYGRCEVQPLPGQTGQPQAGSGTPRYVSSGGNWENIVAHISIATATVEQKARNLQARVTENTDAIDRMRQERSMLLKDHKQLQQQYADVNEVSPTRAAMRGFFHHN